MAVVSVLDTSGRTTGCRHGLLSIHKKDGCIYHEVVVIVNYYVPSLYSQTWMSTLQSNVCTGEVSLPLTRNVQSDRFNEAREVHSVTYAKKVNIVRSL